MLRLWPWQRTDGDRLGRRGERAAARFLRKRGFRILFRNKIFGRYEADLVAMAPDGRTVVLVEVKARRHNADQAAPEERVDRNKRLRLTAIAAHLKKNRRFADSPVRFDVIAIIFPDQGKPAIRHLPAAFDSEI